MTGEMISKWMTAPWGHYVLVLATFVAVYAAILVLTRITGLRSFSKMSAPDFAMTVAVGSLFASSIATGSPPLPLAIFALACLFGGQWIIAWCRRRVSGAAEAIDNDPVLLMREGEFLEDAMARTHVTRADLIAKLREANVIQLSEVRAVVFEATGDVSVLHSRGDEDLEPSLLEGVVGANSTA